MRTLGAAYVERLPEALAVGLRKLSVRGRHVEVRQYSVQVHQHAVPLAGQTVQVDDGHGALFPVRHGMGLAQRVVQIELLKDCAPAISGLRGKAEAKQLQTY
jgi:site-specific recombinase XerC